ncbi:MAG: GNAT family N-acetyltransferase [Acidobacteria bacterium]|nr:GNAT family N-acetyltransferase [Acidobacteriota bacterium]
MAELAIAEGPLLEQILDATHEIWGEGLDRRAHARYYTAQLATPWGRARLSRLALVDRGDVRASAKLYTFDATLDGRAIRVAGIGAVFTQPAQRKRGAAKELIERLLERVSADGAYMADVALLFSEIGPDYYARLGFVPVATSEQQIRVIESTRYGAPATWVRGGDDRDFAVLAALAQTRAEPFRFHLNRDRDLIQYAIAKKRLLAGLGPAGARELHFFAAEEGSSAVAYVVVGVNRTASGVVWTLEECGDRDPTGARVGAILQALVARDPAERRPTIRGWLPSGFRPQQIEIVGEAPAHEIMMMKPLSPAGEAAGSLCAEDVMYWRGDAF